LQIIWIYLGIINLVAVILTLGDKRAAQRDRWRVKEQTLLLISALGGAVSMLIIMRLIRHKTKRAKFMIGIPVIIILQIAAVGLYLWWRTL